MNETFSVTPVGAVESYQTHSQINQIYGVWIDNFSGGWLGIFGTDLWCPPYTRGWKASIFPGTSAITNRSYDFANGNVIAGATGQAAKVTIWDSSQGDSEGIEFFDQQTVPDTFTTVITYTDILAGVLLAAPAVGRYRVYEVSLMYGLSQATPYIGNGETVMVLVYPSGGTTYLAQLEISPAAPRVNQTIVVPGGDAPIGASILYDLLTDNKPNGENVRVSIRYTVI